MTSSTGVESPGKHLSQPNDQVDGSGSILVRNHAHTVTVKLQYTLYQVEYFSVTGVLRHTLVFSYVSQ